jgi:predicted small secreted protein
MRTLVLPFAMCLSLTGCNTMAGLGEDMQQAGANLQSRADQSQQNVAPQYGYEASYSGPEVTGTRRHPRGHTPSTELELCPSALCCAARV